MKRPALIFSFLFIFAPIIFAQTIINNSEKPLSKNAGRTLKLIEELRITDQPGVFYFRSPGNSKITKDGYIYIADPYGNNFLKFSPNGEFLKNLYKKGEGPGEIQDYFDYALSLNRIYIYDYVRGKIISIDHEGKLLSEYKLETERYSDYLGVYKDWLVFLKTVYPPHIDRKTSRFYKIKGEIIKLSRDGRTRKESYIFSNKRFLIASSQGGGMISWDSYISTLDEKKGYLYMAPTREYLVHVLDLEKSKIIRSFRRKYKRVIYEMSNREKESAKKYNAPRKKFTPDIKSLYVNKGLIWVVTSTQDDEKGTMVDVFNEDGQFVDNFFINLKGYLMSVHESSVFIRETDEAGNYVIKKYRIDDYDIKAIRPDFN